MMTNAPRDYDWGSTTLIADLEGRAPSGRPEAEVWFGDHPGCPAHVADGRPLGEWLADEGAATGAPPRLPYLMKLLAAASSLSIQAHPSRAQAIAAFAREDAEGIPRDAPDRTYRDQNHKPELIVAVSETFTALAGVRELDDTRRLLALLGEGGQVLADRLSGSDAAAAVRDTIQWLLAGDSTDVIAQIVAAAAGAESPEFAGEIDLIRRLAVDFPGDRGIGVALLMNLVVLRRGEGLFVPAGVLHAYQTGLGVEIMAASDNVLRGGLTPKHVDVGELVSVLDATPGPVPVLNPAFQHGVARFAPDVPDFALTHVVVEDGETRDIELDGVAIVLATVGAVAVGAVNAAGGPGRAVDLSPGEAVLVTPDEGRVRIFGAGEVFIAEPGAASAPVSAS